MRVEPEYSELGKVLRGWRTPHFRSLLEFYEAGKNGFSFSYSVYSCYERGIKEAPPNVIEEVAGFLKVDPMPALVAWMLPKLGSESLKARVASLSSTPVEGWPAGAAPRAEGERRIDSNSIPLQEVDNTWVFDASERKLVEAKPWLIDFVIGIATRYPDPLPFEELGLESDAAVKAFVKTHLDRWVEDERIAVDWKGRGFRFVKRHIHFPKTEAWQKIRMHMLREAVDDMAPRLTPEAIQARRVHRTLTTRILTKDQQQELVGRLARIERDFFSMPFKGNSDPAPKDKCTLLILMTPRTDSLPDQVKPRKKRPA
ncbi:MAG: hypothetical protein HY075_02105 [Deltaproteobacteria bacterium]|nr:hypothetical protein [Deltaproteobacteria bacterium]